MTKLINLLLDGLILLALATISGILVGITPWWEGFLVLVAQGITGWCLFYMREKLRSHLNHQVDLEMERNRHRDYLINASEVLPADLERAHTLLSWEEINQCVTLRLRRRIDELGSRTHPAPTPVHDIAPVVSDTTSVTTADPLAVGLPMFSPDDPVNVVGYTDSEGRHFTRGRNDEFIEDTPPPAVSREVDLQSFSVVTDGHQDQRESRVESYVDNEGRHFRRGIDGQFVEIIPESAPINGTPQSQPAAQGPQVDEYIRRWHENRRDLARSALNPQEQNRRLREALQILQPQDTLIPFRTFGSPLREERPRPDFDRLFPPDAIKACRVCGSREGRLHAETCSAGGGRVMPYQCEE